MTTTALDIRIDMIYNRNSRILPEQETVSSCMLKE